jgi:hypothetical protein
MDSPVLEIAAVAGSADNERNVNAANTIHGVRDFIARPPLASSPVHRNCSAVAALWLIPTTTLTLTALIDSRYVVPVNSRWQNKLSGRWAPIAVSLLLGAAGAAIVLWLSATSVPAVCPTVLPPPLSCNVVLHQRITSISCAGIAVVICAGIAGLCLSVRRSTAWWLVAAMGLAVAAAAAGGISGLLYLRAH